MDEWKQKDHVCISTYVIISADMLVQILFSFFSWLTQLLSRCHLGITVAVSYQENKEANGDWKTQIWKSFHLDADALYNYFPRRGFVHYRYYYYVLVKLKAAANILVYLGMAISSFMRMCFHQKPHSSPRNRRQNRYISVEKVVPSWGELLAWK